MIEQVIFKLERIVEEFIILNDINSLEDLLLIKNTNAIILNNNNNYDLKYQKKYSLNKVDDLVKGFLKSINLEYYNYYQLRKNDGTIIFEHYPNSNIIPYSTFDYSNNKRKIYIPLFNKLEDAFCIVHELNHDKNLDVNCSSVTRSIFTESLSMLIELLFEDYLVKNRIKDAKITNNLSLYYIKDKSLYIDFNIKLMECYINRYNINYNDYCDIINSYNNRQRKDLKYIIDKMLMDNTVNIDYEHGYILGVLIASYMYDRIKSNKHNIQELFELNEVLNKYTIDQVLDYLDLDYDEYELSQSSYKKLEKSYCNYIKHR